MAALIIGIVASVVFLTAAIIYLKKASAGGSDEERNSLIATLQSIDNELEQLTKRSANKASKGQLESVQGAYIKLQADLESERANLKTVEEKLKKVQKDVEAKEFQQQEVKAAKDDEQAKLTEILDAYSDLSRESIELENRVAQSMKNLDKIMNEVTVNDDQKASLQNLNEALTAAGSLLRELITEYQVLNERLKLLRTQHSDLEEEYTRLVEQQLGE